MSSEGPPPPPPPPPPPRRPEGAGRPSGPGGAGGPAGPGGSAGPGGLRPTAASRWVLWAALGVCAFVVILLLNQGTEKGKELSYSEFLNQVANEKVAEVTYDNVNAKITGKFASGSEFHTTGLQPFPEPDLELLREHDVVLKPKTPQAGLIEQWLPVLLFPLLIIGFFVFMQRRAQGQMGNIMSIGRSRAKTYSTERPGTTFADVAGYEGVKTEIREVVDFLKYPEKFSQIGARIPKGVLLVGPPGTGKTLIARAVAGEAGVPFLSVSGSDFMEMFVGVGASRVRDLFQTARKMGRAIIFIDEIDSIGRKRGAGLGGGHDEREQTLNQMLNEMDGFEATEGIVMIAATNRPDVLDPALLRPGRFDRQVVVPLPEHEERLAILRVHAKSKRISPDVDLAVLARGTPGMSGAELANLVNEAALHAVRRGGEMITRDDFEYARDRVLMGQRRESMALSEKEKELTAYHEAGHAVCATVLETADPVHKVTILPMGMALGVTQQLPQEDKHSYNQNYLEESIVVAMGGRIAERLVFGVVSTGANNDLVVSTERARKMVREWGMSERIGPMAWGSQGQVFLGEDLMHNARDYSDDTARVIDQETEKILRACEQKCVEVLTEHRNGLDLVARSLLEHETLDGAEVRRLVDLGANAPEATGTDPAEIPAYEAGSQAGDADADADADADGQRHDAAPATSED